MAGINKIIILGRLGSNPEMRTMPNGEQVANISVATSESWTDKNSGERKELTEWHRIVFYRRQAEICGQYLKKGYKVYVEGRLRTRKWQDQHGQERYTTEIQGETSNQQTQSSKPNAYAQAKEGRYNNPPQQAGDSFDDIPF